jgi:tRNA threonylcarbamoyladenosine biosynthesis protein TsaE
LGGGKTTFVRGLARGLGSSDIVSSPTFTLSKDYKAGDTMLRHFDFYRLREPGVLRDQLQESLAEENTITVVEWGNIVADVLPSSKMSVEFKPTANDADEREITVEYSDNFTKIVKAVEAGWKEVRP